MVPPYGQALYPYQVTCRVYSIIVCMSVTHVSWILNSCSFIHSSGHSSILGCVHLNYVAHFHTSVVQQYILICCWTYDKLDNQCFLKISRIWSMIGSCQVQENNGSNSGNSRCQVWTYEMLEGTLASAYVLHPFQTLVPRFWNEEDGGSEIRGLEWRFGVVLRVELRGWVLRWELIRYLNWSIYMTSLRYLY